MIPEPVFPVFRHPDLVLHGAREAWATFSRDGAYRYALGREWDPAPLGDGFDAIRPTMVWVMLNPSTADHSEDDPTIRKCIGFAKRHGCRGIVVVNLFAWRATDPKELTHAKDPVGEHNDAAIVWAVRLFWTMRIAGWGRFPSRAVERLAVAPMATAKKMGSLSCFGTTAGGEPRHPLMLAYDTPLLAAGKWPR